MGETKETATEIVALKQMENTGFVTENSNSPDEPVANSTVLSPRELSSLGTVPLNGHCPTPKVACVAPRTVCACVESQTACTCGSTPPAKSKVELLTWVTPKGWILLGIGFAFVAWSAIFFTLSALEMI